MEPLGRSSRRPLVLAVLRDTGELSATEAELQRGFGCDFRVRGEADAEAGLRTLRHAAEHADPVAVVLVDETLAPDDRAALLRAARTDHADARRALLVRWGSWGDRRTASAILQAMALGDIHYYVLKPWTARDELFRRTVAEFLQEWSRSEPSNLREVVVVADPQSPRA